LLEINHSLFAAGDQNFTDTGFFNQAPGRFGQAGVVHNFDTRSQSRLLFIGRY
jgi:hypothetical protein